MIDTMEQNKEMTAQESLKIITETMNNNRQEIVRHGGKYFFMWGILLTVFSLLVYILWKTTDNVAWNNLWFAMPVIGYLLAWLLLDRKQEERVSSEVSRITSGIWMTFGIFASAVAAFTLIYSQLNGDSSSIGRVIRVMVSIGSLTAELVLIFGLAECACGVALKNWVMKIAGFVTGIGGLAIYYITGACEEQMFIFTFAGLVLIVTGLVVKHQYK